MNTTSFDPTDLLSEASPPTSVETDLPTAETPPPAGDNSRPLEDELRMIREQFESNLKAEGDEYEAGEERHAILLDMGYRNALAWLANASLLRTYLTKIGLTPAKDDIGLLGQIAKMQLGRWTVVKGKGDAVWSVPSRRDDRLGRFYRIFYRDKAKYPADNIKAVVLAHSGKSGGILKVEARDNAPAKATKKELAANMALAKKVEPRATVTSPWSFGKQGEYRLAVVRVSAQGLDICDMVEGEDAITTRMVDKWAAKAALTVSS